LITYVDTSAILAILDSAEHRNAAAVRTWDRLVTDRQEMVISSYGVCEAAAVLQNRLGIEALRAFADEMLPLMRVEWVDSGLHSAAMLMVLACSTKGGPSLVDCTAFEVIHRRGVGDVFAYDKHFAARGFNLIGQNP
jgi:uncharacterized protein